MPVLEIPFDSGTNELDMALREMEEALKEYKAAIEKVKRAGCELDINWDGSDSDRFCVLRDELYWRHKSVESIATMMIAAGRKKLELDRADGGDAAQLSVQQKPKE